jgi:hypothetical protein
MRLEHSPYNGHEIERDIWLNGGRVVKNPINTTQFIVTDRVNFAVKTF